MLEIGSVLDGKYKILSEIGHGGMSVVYLALNERANKTWAVKEVRKDGGNDSEVVSQGLVAETEMLKKLSHPNLPSIVDVIDKSDTFIIVMDYIEGRSLQSVVNHSGAQDPDIVLEWAKQLCDVLGYLHSRTPAIIYRDMKPANVMLRPDGQVALIDFGTAREYKEHSQGDTTWLGTRGYAAPEQFGGRGQTDARTDIYCLGATMYHLLTGYSPADTQFVIHPLGQLVPELAGTGFEKVVAKCCEPDPSNRYQNCAELMYALEHVHDEDAAAVRERNRKWKLFIVACCAALAGMIGMAAFGILGNVTSANYYEEQLGRVSSDKDYKTNAAWCASAMKVVPDRADAYNTLLSYATISEGEEGGLISSNEKQILEETINSSDNSKKRPNIDLFKKNNPKEYTNFQYNRAMKYFFACNTGKQEAQTIFGAMKNDENLDEQKRKIAECLELLSGVYANNAVKEGNLYEQHAEDSEKYRDTWDELESIAGDPGKINEITGDTFYSAAIYNEIAKQVQNYYVSYQDAGITDEQMKKLLEAGRAFLNGAKTNDRSTQIMIDNAKEEIDSAGHLLTQDQKRDTNIGSSPSGGSEKGGD